MSTSRPWGVGIKDPAVRQNALTVSRAVGERLASRQIDDPTLGEGKLGVALLLVALHRQFGERTFLRRAIELLHEASGAISSSPGRLAPGPLAGVAGLGWVSWYLSRATDTTDVVSPTIDRSVLELLGQLDSGDRLASPPEYDLMYGLSGVSLYLSRHGSTAKAADLQRVRRRLTWLADPLDDGPRSRAAGQHQNSDGTVVDLGLAHGIAGLVVALSAQSTERSDYRQIEEAIGRLARMLVAHLHQLQSNGESLSGTPPQWSRGQGWCYGLSGMARALWLAGRRLNDRSMQRAAFDAVVSVTTTQSQKWDGASACFCHGTAGLLHIVSRFHDETSSPELAAFATRLASSLCEQADLSAGSPWPTVDYHGVEDRSPGLLLGPAGVALALLSAAGTEVPEWDRVFGLS